MHSFSSTQTTAQRDNIMQKTIVSAALLLVIILLSGCAPAATPPPPTVTSPPIPSTSTPQPTQTPIPTSTRVIPVWEGFSFINSPFTFADKGGHYHLEDLSSKSVKFDTDTKWKIDIEVENSSDVSTGFVVTGYSSDTEQSFNLIYTSGRWVIGYGEYGRAFEQLTSPKESFELTFSPSTRLFTMVTSDGFEFKHRIDEKLFHGVEVLSARALIGPRTTLTLSNIVVEQLRIPTEAAEGTVHMALPHSIDFEDLSTSNPTEISPFLYPNRLDVSNLFASQRWNRQYDLNSWQVDDRARSGTMALNVIPNGNPATDGMIPVTIAFLEPVFDISGYKTASIDLWINTTSNPRVNTVHNCDSSLYFYYRIDSGDWNSAGVVCGEHKTESQGWQKASREFDVTGKSTIQFAFVYQVQSVSQADPAAYFLIDDVTVAAK
jgi:hypothetical protein